MKCHNCGLPEGALAHPGYTTDVILKPENNYKSSRKASIWVCSEDCGVQSLAISQYGSVSSKWTVTLAQARNIFRRLLCPVTNS